MAGYRLSPTAAFDFSVRMSQTTNTKLRVIAAESSNGGKQGVARADRCETPRWRGRPRRQCRGSRNCCTYFDRLAQQ
jgi:hypothetical protein